MVRDSIRLRLTVWHIVVIALLLGAFSAGTWIFLVRSARARLHSSLVDTSGSFIAGWRAERAEHGATPATAASDAVAEFRYRDGQIVVFDRSGRSIAMSDSSAPEITLDTVVRTSGGLSLADWAARAPSSGDGSFTTLQRGDDEDTQVRAYARQATVAGEVFSVAVVGSLHAEGEAAEAFVEALSVIIPIVITFAGLGGYLLARASLAPVVAMARHAERTSALNLHERIPVDNPRDELGRLATVLNGLLDRLQLAFRQEQRAADQQRNFMADASHELRTPVTAIRSVAEVALSRRDRSHEELIDALDVVRGEAARLGRVVDDLFLLSRADAGEVPVRAELIYLEEVIQDCARSARAMATRRNVSLVVPLPDEAPFMGDPLLLRRLVTILLDNAIKYTPPGGEVRLLLERPAVMPQVYKIAVEDSGPGVPPEASERIFERFFRLNTARTRPLASPSDTGELQAAGAGLGLSIARWIAGAHGGTVRLEATGVPGSRFVVSLPTGHPRPEVLS